MKHSAFPGFDLVELSCSLISGICSAASETSVDPRNALVILILYIHLSTPHSERGRVKEEQEEPANTL